MTVVMMTTVVVVTTMAIVVKVSDSGGSNSNSGGEGNDDNGSNNGNSGGEGSNNSGGDNCNGGGSNNDDNCGGGIDDNGGSGSSCGNNNGGGIQTCTAEAEADHETRTNHTTEHRKCFGDWELSSEAGERPIWHLGKWGFVIRRTISDGVRLFVGLPLDAVSYDCNSINHARAIAAGLKALKLLGVEGVELPICGELLRKMPWENITVDNLPVLDGKTPVQVYQSFCESFKSSFSPFMGSTITSISMGLGPDGELRYPSHHRLPSNGKTLGAGEFQCYDQNMLSFLKQHAEASGNPLWGLGGPHDAATYDQSPFSSGFFNDGGSWQSTYGGFFSLGIPISS
ncbi:Inactive beta-amylase 9 [Spatholobus suberectus]|nr:Inactive beta-amylase 9 [Spatholobus suberectus]